MRFGRPGGGRASAGAPYLPPESLGSPSQWWIICVPHAADVNPETRNRTGRSPLVRGHAKHGDFGDRNARAGELAAGRGQHPVVSCPPKLTDRCRGPGLPGAACGSARWPLKSSGLKELARPRRADASCALRSRAWPRRAGWASASRLAIFGKCVPPWLSPLHRRNDLPPALGLVGPKSSSGNRGT
jgi:hypothetical protein